MLGVGSASTDISSCMVSAANVWCLQQEVEKRQGSKIQLLLWNVLVRGFKHLTSLCIRL